ncbi:phage minor head protein [Pseudoxanthomonas winnipegensis]|uniref:Head morphogenesis protein n=1 Tax=Pseudoxanthomonas winnipegensis TaxID=2480810 RepID=A0A4Q8LZ09_9GAMM|nr:phage minor head protein [Pseudoxanthomonas winnipegensis]RZZ90599.1 head morphogenesis protein [Pseudoxanthomonas winnipegensis]TAA37245.1 head morphogenesis protein [Pseudoxanthomonas winnipegensis]
MPATSARQLDQLAKKLEPPIAKAFLQAVAQVRGKAVVPLIAELLQAGRVDEVMQVLGLDEAQFTDLGEALRDAYKAGGQQATTEMPRIRLSLDPGITGSYQPRSQSPVLTIRFDLRNPVAEQWVREASSKLITEILDSQREAIRNTLAQGIAAGRNPRQTALDIVGRTAETGRRSGGIVGLTSQQAGFVSNVRAELASGDPKLMGHYFTRGRRDRRLDGIVRRAIAAGKPVGQADIDKIAGRYADRLLQLRGDMIARTESIASMAAGREEGYRQQIAAGNLDPENVTGTWDTAGDNHVRHSHAAMNGQQRKFGQPFQSPSGAQMLYPGDTSQGAGPEEIIGCRCHKQYRINMAAEALRGQQVR